MTIDEIRQRIAAIRAIATDDERAHGKEDRLYADFIQSVADGDADDLPAKAKLVLTTADIDFARWCA